jgi:glycine/D-amino acid oxidase-like deaminating enzyme/nitrite reductase/ring-hydroxylating ferredoxin subunit
MSDHHHHSIPPWPAAGDIPTPVPLTVDTSTQVCVVGAGIAGTMTAYLLAKAGKSVVLLDRLGIGGGETGRTTAHLSNALDRRYYRLARLHGKEGARFAAASHTAAIDRLEAIAREEGIDCDFQRLDGYLFVPSGKSLDELKRERDAACEAGLYDLEIVARAPLTSFDTGPALRFPRQAQFHPLKFLAGLAQATERLGGRIYGDAFVNEVHGGPGAFVRTSRGTRVLAEAIVVATNVPFNDWVVIHTKQAPYRTYAIGLRIPRSIVPRALYWDTLDPYHYVRVHDFPGEPQSELLIVGGEDHKTGQHKQTSEAHEKLEAWTRSRFPAAGAVAFRWSGQVVEPVDGLAYIGRNPGDAPNVHIATGDAGMGMTHGAIAGMLLTDLICGRTNPWQGLYDPSRKWTSNLREYASENLNVAAQYFDWVTGGEVNSVQDIPSGSGAVVREGFSKICAYRDERGVLHRHSAVCPHLGCIVGWNATEHSWDCPCHGSRFDALGHVIQGPAASDLAPVEEKATSMA